MSWRHVQLLDAEAVLIDDGTLDGFADTAEAQVFWDLPIHPTWVSFGVLGSWSTGPLGTVLPDPSTGAIPNVPRWTVGARLTQRFELRRSALTVEVDGSWVELLDDDRDLTGWSWVGPPLVSGPRIAVSAQVGFR